MSVPSQRFAGTVEIALPHKQIIGVKRGHNEDADARLGQWRGQRSRDAYHIEVDRSHSAQAPPIALAPDAGRHNFL
jgi:hypothetical protein